MSAKEEFAKILFKQWLEHLKEEHPELVKFVEENYEIKMENDMKLEDVPVE